MHPLVVLHGWSDSSSSFRRLGAWLRDAGLSSRPLLISLADYITLDDDVRMDDIVAAMDRAWSDHELPRDHRSVDLVVHSTGGLVVRDWMTRHALPDRNPIHHLLMLAPANFGSPLAHKGRSFIGRIAKGWGDKLFETGTHVLGALELASPYQWSLAERDRLGEERWYGPDRVLCTVLVGNTGYSGISAAANEDGSDGTVRVSTAHLDPVYAQLDFCTDPMSPSLTVIRPEGRTAFAVLDGHQHSSIAFKGRRRMDETLAGMISDALTVDDAGFETHRRRLAEHTEAVMERRSGDRYKHGYQNTVFRVRDDAGAHVGDYFLEFYADDRGDAFAKRFHEDLIRSVHAYGDDSAYRSVLVDVTALRRYLEQRSGLDEFSISLTALPEYIPDRRARRRARNTNVVGYLTAGDEQIGGVPVTRETLDTLFAPNRTLLVDITIRRHRDETVFGLSGLAS